MGFISFLMLLGQNFNFFEENNGSTIFIDENFSRSDGEGKSVGKFIRGMIFFTDFVIS